MSSNRTSYKGSKSKYKNVYFEKGRTKPWKATVHMYGKTNHIGYYKTEDEAAAATSQFKLTQLTKTSAHENNGHLQDPIQ